LAGSISGINGGCVELSVDGEEESGMRFWTIAFAILTISVLARFAVCDRDS
jgi:hypothetical protein